MNITRLNASWMTVQVPTEEEDNWYPLYRVLEGAALALPEGIMPPPDGCIQHDKFNPRHALCWSVFRGYDAYRLYRMWLEGDNLYIRIPIGTLLFILTASSYRDKLPDEVRTMLRQILMSKYPPRHILHFEEEDFPVKLFPYQRKAIYESIGYRRAIISAPPGTGKTEMGSALISSMPKGWRVGWFTHTRTLLRQSQERLARNLREPIGVISGEESFAPQRVTVAMVQTINSRLEKDDEAVRSWLYNIDALVLDEAHHAPAKTFYRSIQYCYRAWVRFGLTATPMREQEEETLYMWAAFSPFVVHVSHEELVEAERLVPIELTAYDLEGLIPTYRGYSNWREEYMETIVRNKYRNAIIAADALAYRPSVILVWSLEHIPLILQAIDQLIEKYDLGEIKVGVMRGDTPSMERQALVEAFENEDIDILIISDVGKEGLNIVNMRTLIVAAGQKSKVAAVQRVGRALRPKRWKVARVVDFLDTGRVTRRHSIKRVNTYQQNLYVSKRRIIPASVALTELRDALREEGKVKLAFI